MSDEPKTDVQLPQGYEDAKPVKGSVSSSVVLPPGFEDAKPVQQSEQPNSSDVKLPKGYEDAKPVQSHLDSDTQAAADRLNQNPIEGAEFHALPSIWDRIKGATLHPISYLGDVEKDLGEGGGRTVVGRTLGQMQARGDQGFQAPPPSLIPNVPLGATKTIRGALRAYGPPQLDKPIGDQIKERVGGVNELTSGAMEATGPLAAVLAPEGSFLPKVLPAVLAQHYVKKGLGSIGVPDEYAELGGNAAGVIAAESVEDPALAARTGAKATDATAGRAVRYGLKKILPNSLSPAIEESVHVPGKTLGLEPSEKIVGSLTQNVDAAREQLRLAEKRVASYKNAGIIPPEEVTRGLNRAKSNFTTAVEHQAVAEENVPLEKNITNRTELAKNSPGYASRLTDPNIVEAPSPSEYAERWRTPEKKAEYYGQSVLSGPNKPNVPYTHTPLLDESEIGIPEARSASDEVIPREIANVISSKPQSTEGASVLGKIKVPAEQTSAQPSVPEGASALGRIKVSGEPTSQPIPAEAPESPLGRISLRDLDALENSIREGVGGAEPLKRNVPLRDQATAASEEPVQLSSDPRKNVLLQAGAKPEQIAKLLPLRNFELRQLAISLGEDMKDLNIGRGKGDLAAGTHISPAEVYQRLLQRHSLAELVKAVDEGRHLPPVSGGSGANSPTFFSKAERVAEEKVNSGPGDSILSTLRNNGVKESEIEAIGLDDYLKGKSKVNKNDVLNYIKSNKLEVRDVDLGGEGRDKRLELTKLRDSASVENNRLWSDVLRREPLSTELFNVMDKGDPQEVIQRMPENVRDAAYRFIATDSMIRNYDSALSKMGDAKETKYGKWTLPGESKNYTEKLITLPKNGPETTPLEWKQNHRGKWAWFQGDEQISGAYPDQSDSDNARQSIKVVKNDFRSSHFEEPNILTHVRYDERPASDGKKTLFLEEVQSDWHQQGKQIGYRAPLSDKQLPDGVFVTKDDDEFQVVGRSGNRLLTRNYPTEREAIRAANEHYASDRYRTGVPDAPFKGDWHELAMKRMLREAAEKGYDRLAWTTGDQQAERYDLSKHIGSLEYDMKSNTLVGRDPDGRKVIEEEIDPNQKDLARYIGEEPAKKLMRQIDNHPGHPDHDDLWQMFSNDYHIKEVPDPEDEDNTQYAVMRDGEELNRFDTESAADRAISDEIYFEIENYEHEPNPSLEGLDLKTGGEWASALYDRAIPNFINRYLKKYGVKVGTTEISTSEPGTLRFEVLDPHGNVHDAFRNKEGAEDAVRDYNDAHRRQLGLFHGERGQWTVRDNGKTEKAHSIEITPEMKKDLLEKGQPISKNEPELIPPQKASPLGQIETYA